MKSLINRNVLILFLIVSSLSFIKSEWSQFSFKDGGPKPRSGHCMITVESKYYNSLSNKQQDLLNNVKLLYRDYEYNQNFNLLGEIDESSGSNVGKGDEKVNEFFKNIKNSKPLILESSTPTDFDDTLSNNNNSYWIYGGGFLYSLELVTPPILMIKDRSGYFQELSFTTINNNPGLRWGHTCQLSGGVQAINSTEILMFGGNKNITGNDLSGELWKFNLQTNSWSLLSDYKSPPIPESSSSSNESLSSSSSQSNDTSIVNKNGNTTGNSTDIKEILPFARTFHSSISNLTSFFVFGGITNQSEGLVVENDFWIYNIKNSTWRLLDKPEDGVYPSPRYGHTMVLVQDIIYIFGGLTSLLQNGVPNNQLWKFNTITGDWSKYDFDFDDDEPSPRGYHSMVVDSKKESAFFIFGGTGTYSIEFNDLWIFDLDSESWESIDTSYNPPNLKKLAMTVSSDFNGFLMYGGGGDPSLFYTYGLECNCNGRGGCFYGVCSCFTGYFGEYCQSSIDGPILLGLGLAVSVPILCFGWCVLRCTTLPARMKILTIIIVTISCSLFVSVESCLSCWIPEAIMGVITGMVGLFGIWKYKSARVILYFTLSVFLTLGVGGYGLIYFLTICMMGVCRNDQPSKLWLPKYAIIMSFVHMAFLILVLPLSFKLYRHRKYMQRISNTATSNNPIVNNGFLFTNPLSQDPVNPLLKKMVENNNNNNNNNEDSHQKALNYLQKEYHLRNELHKLRISKSNSTSDDLRIRVDRNNILEDTYRQLGDVGTGILLQNISVKFIDEEGVDMGGLRKEWFSLLFKQVFDPSYGLFVLNSNYTLSISPNSHLQTDYLSFFLFAGKMVARSVIEGVHLDHTFSRTIYKLVLGKPPMLDDLLFVDPPFYKSLRWILENSVDEMEEVTFSTTQEQLDVGLVLVDLKPNGRDILVDEDNKQEFVDLMTQWRFQRDISDQAYHFIMGFREIIPLDLISNFTECELELFICGLIEIDINDWKQNTTYRGYTNTSSIIEWFWEIVSEMEIEDRIRLLQFVTGNARLPPSGFQGLVSGDANIKFQIHKTYTPDNQLPVARTCFNRLDLPNYDSKDSLKYYLYLAIRIGLPGFGLS